MLSTSPSAGGSIDAALKVWRAKAMDLFLIVNCIAMVPMLAATATTAHLPLGHRLFRIAVGVTIGAITLLRGVDVKIRGWVLAGILFASAVVGLATSGMAGQGRVILLITPVWMLVLVGRRSGWVAAGLSVVIYAVFTTLVETKVLSGWLVLPENPVSTGFWVLQGFVLLFALVPVMALLERFLRFQIRTLQSERTTSLELEKEVARRTQAHDALRHEMAERRRLEKEITQITDQERQHFGSEIHDGLCQQLTAALLHCSVLEKELDRQGSSEAARARTLRELLEESIDDAYDIAKGLCPVDLDPEALVPALERMTTRARAISDVACEFHQEGNVTIPDSENAYQLHRIALEALNNAVRHAGARRICVELDGRGDQIVLRVQDDGRGIRTAGPSTAGMGLRIMTYRAHMMGGTLTVDPAPDHGTIVTCTVPRQTSNSMEGTTT